jgi:probable HAF family extracellular repeat protein
MPAYIFTTLDDPTATNDAALGINDLGQVVGYYSDSGGGAHGFLYNPSTGTYTTIDYPGAVRTEAYGIDHAGQIVGYYYDSGGGLHGFLYNPPGSFTSTRRPKPPWRLHHHRLSGRRWH